MTLAQLREEKNTLSTRIQELAKEAEKEVNGEIRGFTTEERAEWDKINERYNVVLAKVTDQESIASRAAEVAKQQAERNPETRDIGREDFDGADHRGGERREKRDAGPSSLETALAIQAWARQQTGRELNESHIAAAKRCGIRPQAQEIEIKLCDDSQLRHLRASEPERRALQYGDAAEGGYTIPKGFVADLERAMLWYGPMLQKCRIINTATGNELHWPKVTDTSATGVLVAEESTVETFVDPVFSEMVLNAYKYSSKGVKVSVELLEDSAFNLASELADMLGERLGRILNTAFTTHDGSSKPQGIVHSGGAGTGVTSATATVIKTDELIDLIHSVDRAYRPNCEFMMHDGIMAYIRKLKTSDGQYIWQPGMQAGVADRLFGYPVNINNDMQSTVATATRTVLFADFSKYIIRRVGSIRLRRLVELYAATDQEAFIAFMRADGDLLQASAAKVLLQA